MTTFTVAIVLILSPLWANARVAPPAPASSPAQLWQRQLQLGPGNGNFSGIPLLSLNRDGNGKVSPGENAERIPSIRTVVQCPLDKDATGRAAWSYLHTMAAHYPDDELTPRQRDHLRQFLHLFAELYPCREYGRDFYQLTNTNSPLLRRGSDIALWLCHLHNSVNHRLGKNNFDCGLLDARWKEGLPDGTCLEFPLVPINFIREQQQKQQQQVPFQTIK